MKIFQLRAARSTLGISVRQLGEYIGLTGSAISLIENKNNFDNINMKQENIDILEQLFAIKNIHFPDSETIIYNGDIKPLHSQQKYLTCFQLKCARYIMHITQKELANAISIDRYVIVRAEKLQYDYFINTKDIQIPYKIKNFFELSGIEFNNPLSITYKQNKP